MKKILNSSAHRFFLITALFFGLLIIVLTPPFQVPDEGHHLYRAYHIAEGNSFGEQTADARFGGNLPTSLIAFERSWRYLRYNYEAKTNLKKLSPLALTSLQSQKKEFADFPNVAYYVPIPYLAQATFLKIGIWLETAPLLLLFGTRVFGFLFWVMLLFYAIKIIPFHKNTFTLLALLPSSLFINSGMTADSFTYGVCYFLFAILLRLIYTNTKANYKWWALLLICSLSVILSKVVYLPLLLLSLLIPKKNFVKKWSKPIFVTSLIIINLIAVFILYSNLKNEFISYENYNPNYRTDVQLNEGVNPNEQLAFILEHPTQFSKIALKSHLAYAPASVVHCIGKFGWEKNYLPFSIIGLLLLTITLSSIFERNFSYKISKKQRLIFLFSTLSIVVLFTLVIYMQWSPVGNAEILSLGGRYYLPILPLLFFSLKTTKMTINQQYLTALVRSVVLGALTIAIICLIMRYYI